MNIGLLLKTYPTLLLVAIGAFYSQFPMKSCKQQSNMVKVENVKGTFHRISPKENYKLLNPGDSIILIISGRGEMPGYSMKPEGVYWVDESHSSTPLPVELVTRSLPFIYSKNEKANPSV